MDDDGKRRAEPAPVQHDDGPLAGFVLIRDWLARDGSSAFETYDQLEWFLRKHPRELARCKDYVLARGRRYVGPGFSSFVDEMLRLETEERHKRARDRAAGRKLEPRPA